MIKLKSLLSEKYLGFGAGKVKEQQLPDASATDIMQGLDRDPATGNLRDTKDRYFVLVWHSGSKTWENEEGHLTIEVDNLEKAKKIAKDRYEDDTDYSWGVWDNKLNKIVFTIGNAHKDRSFINLNYKELPLDQLKFDDLVKIFRVKDYFNDVHFNRMQPDGKEGPYYRDGLSFPNPSDASSIVADMKSLENWKEKTKRRFGNVKVILDPDAEEHWEKVKVDDERFTQDQKDANDAKMDMLKQWGTSE